MVKLVDTPASGAGDRKVVEVRVFFWAPISSLRLDQFQGSHKNPRKRVFAFQASGLLKLNQGFTDQNALRIVRHINSGNACDYAQMVKLVDTPASGAGDRKVVEVRVFFWAPIQIQGHDLEFHRNPRKRVFAFLAFENPKPILPCGEGACSRWSAKRSSSFQQLHRTLRVYDCFAAEREQAPSPQNSPPPF